MVDVPWRRQTAQEKGRSSEKRIARSMGARPHPGSGSGTIKFDASNDEELIELKEAAKSFTLSRRLVAELHKHAVRRGLTPTLVISFPGYRVVARIERTNDG